MKKQSQTHIPLTGYTDDSKDTRTPDSTLERGAKRAGETVKKSRTSIRPFVETARKRPARAQTKTHTLWTLSYFCRFDGVSQPYSRHVRKKISPLFLENMDILKKQFSTKTIARRSARLWANLRHPLMAAPWPPLSSPATRNATVAFK
jgi:hypothetical protein